MERTIFIKRCSKCKEEKNIDFFNKNKGTKDGYNYYCKKCCGIYSKKHHIKNCERINKRNKQYRINNPEKVSEANKQWRINNPEKFKEMNKRCCLKRDYALSLEEYYKMLENQNGCCIICGTHQDKLKIPLCVDHNHSTGKIRGLLCSKCNRGIGMFKEDIKTFYKIIDYLN